MKPPGKACIEFSAPKESFHFHTRRRTYSDPFFSRREIPRQLFARHAPRSYPAFGIANATPISPLLSGASLRPREAGRHLSPNWHPRGWALPRGWPPHHTGVGARNIQTGLLASESRLSKIIVNTCGEDPTNWRIIKTQNSTHFIIVPLSLFHQKMFQIVSQTIAPAGGITNTEHNNRRNLNPAKLRRRCGQPLHIKSPKRTTQKALNFIFPPVETERSRTPKRAQPRRPLGAGLPLCGVAGAGPPPAPRPPRPREALAGPPGRLWCNPPPNAWTPQGPRCFIPDLLFGESERGGGRPSQVMI